MKLNNWGLGVLAVLGGTNALRVTQSPQEAPIPGYGVQDIYWEAVLGPAGPTIRHLGTWEGFFEKILEADPNADRGHIYGGYPGRTRAPPGRQDSHDNNTNGTDTGLMKRDSPLYCYNYPGASCSAIEHGIDYLRDVPFQPTNGPGPGNCGRVSCSYRAAIWWCNDNHHPKTLSWDDIANAAQNILNQCGCDSKTKISGQAYHDDGWNVIVRRDSC